VLSGKEREETENPRARAVERSATPDKVGGSFDCELDPIWVDFFRRAVLEAIVTRALEQFEADAAGDNRNRAALERDLAGLETELATLGNQASGNSTITPGHPLRRKLSLPSLGSFGNAMQRATTASISHGACPTSLAADRHMGGGVSIRSGICIYFSDSTL
jgi:hypothetical protein